MKLKNLIATIVLASALPLNGAEDDEMPGAPVPIRLIIPEARLQQIRNNIDKLFRNRGPSRIAPDSRQNPFRTAADLVTQTTTVAGNQSDGAQFSMNSDAILLGEAVKTLSIGGGTFKGSDGKLSIIINQQSFGEGAQIRPKVRDTVVTLRIGRITNTGVTFVLNSAEQTVSLLTQGN